jgi:hypothetical protein
MNELLGQIMLFRLGSNQLARINAEHITGAHCNSYQLGDQVPMIVVRDWGDEMVNGKLLLDGDFDLWVTSAREGTEPGQWSRRFLTTTLI